ncbi:hypothetical protein [Trinickia sp.]|uniref:hypothetical protein n=1 Tax=Trinickia sp. TaxID=2571163 RepID=UPI003F7FBE5A
MSGASQSIRRPGGDFAAAHTAMLSPVIRCKTRKSRRLAAFGAPFLFSAGQYSDAASRSIYPARRHHLDFHDHYKIFNLK